MGLIAGIGAAVTPSFSNNNGLNNGSNDEVPGQAVFRFSLKDQALQIGNLEIFL